MDQDNFQYIRNCGLELDVSLCVLSIVVYNIKAHQLIRV